MARVVIFGCGRGADTAYRYLSRDSDHEVRAFAVEARFLKQSVFHGLPVVAYESIVERFPPDGYEMFVPLGFQQMNGLRKEKYLDAKNKGYRFVSYVNSHNYALEPIVVGENCFVLENQIVNLDVSIGSNVTIWSGNQIGDRSVIGDHVWIASRVTLSGDVSVGDSCFLGVNSCVSNNVKLAPRTFVGANTLISHDTEEGSVYVSPAAKKVDVTSEKFLAMLNLT